MAEGKPWALLQLLIIKSMIAECLGVIFGCGDVEVRNGTAGEWSLSFWKRWGENVKIIESDSISSKIATHGIKLAR